MATEWQWYLIFFRKNGCYIYSQKHKVLTWWFPIENDKNSEIIQWYIRSLWPLPCLVEASHSISDWVVGPDVTQTADSICLSSRIHLLDLQWRDVTLASDEHFEPNTTVSRVVVSKLKFSLMLVEGGVSFLNSEYRLPRNWDLTARVIVPSHNKVTYFTNKPKQHVILPWFGVLYPKEHMYPGWAPLH